MSSCFLFFPFDPLAVIVFYLFPIAMKLLSEFNNHTLQPFLSQYKNVQYKENENSVLSRQTKLIIFRRYKTL